MKSRRLFDVGQQDCAISRARQFNRGGISVNSVQRKISRRQQLAEQTLRTANIVHHTSTPRAIAAADNAAASRRFARAKNTDRT